MTNQEAFDKVVAHLKQMKQRCYSQLRGGCTYFDPATKNRCAIGTLLTEEEARKARGDVYCVVFSLNPPSLKGLDKGLLARLQGIHDSQDGWNKNGFYRWDRFKEAALAYNLDASQVPKENHDQSLSTP
jgi:hypothetical protein